MRIAAAFDAWHRRITAPVGFHLFIAVTLAVCWTLRVTLFAGTGGDDAEQLVFSQTFAWGYGIGNPPLFTWVTAAAATVFGPGVGLVEAVKFAALALTYVLLYRAGRILLADHRLAALAAMAPLALYPVGWDAVLGFTHSVFLMAAVAGFFLCLLRLRAGAGWAVYLLTGFAAACGMLAKYNFGLIAGALLIAALCDPVLRSRLLSLKFAAAVLLAALLFAPHGVWVWERLPELGRFAADRLSGEAGADWSKATGRGLAAAAGGALAFLTPLLFLVAGFWPRIFLPNAAPGPRAPSRPDAACSASHTCSSPSASSPRSPVSRSRKSAATSSSC
jgi:4-amino-4-deoxy-L-arabinose transferase-like glycosyltransferase